MLVLVAIAGSLVLDEKLPLETAGVSIFYKLAGNIGMSLRVFISYRFLFAAAFRFLFDEHHAGVEAGNDDGVSGGAFAGVSILYKVADNIGMRLIESLNRLPSPICSCKNLANRKQ
ncbi:hypothetical protein RHGRI_032298 [Rhododendron griersonianum]|uniref:Uncharacterized protein n=1 Tax=Rhododendron griersonianum TaxID=479676 RepID=A0AAV6IBH6_9ERIC|nr:hypothetical protein RHGRI_032298 [Rhododendron griersonianum]